jgi:hypothetical protein
LIRLHYTNKTSDPSKFKAHGVYWILGVIENNHGKTISDKLPLFFFLHFRCKVPCHGLGEQCGERGEGRGERGERREERGEGIGERGEGRGKREEKRREERDQKEEKERKERRKKGRGRINKPFFSFQATRCVASGLLVWWIPMSSKKWWYSGHSGVSEEKLK